MQHFIMICFSAKVDHPLIFSSKWAFYCFSSKFHFNWMFSKQCSFSSPSFVCTQRIVQMFIRLTQTNAFDANAPETFHLFSATREMKYNRDSRTKKPVPEKRVLEIFEEFLAQGHWITAQLRPRTGGLSRPSVFCRVACQPSLPGFYG